MLAPLAKQRRWPFLLSVIATLALTAPSLGQTNDLAAAKRLFRAGARAYDAGQFAAAVQAFDQAYELSPRPALRFSAAQALKRQYTLDRDPALLRTAQAYYQEYLRSEKQGKRVKDAVEALGEIDILLQTLETPSPTVGGADPGGESGEGAEGGGEPAPAPTTPSASPVTPPTMGTLQVDSNVTGASATVVGPDGTQELTELPRWLEVPPGTYEVTIRAEGYDDGGRTVRVDAGRISLADPPLREKPARVTISADEGAEVLVDGRPMGRTPLSLELPSGGHRVIVGQDGYDVFARNLDLGRDDEHLVEADLSMTGQRIAAWTFIGVSAASGVVGISLAIAGAREQVLARRIADLADPSRTDTPRALTPAERDTYNGHISTRDNFARFAGGAIALGVVSGTVGLLLYALDEPDLYGAAAKSDDDRPSSSETPIPLEIDASITPVGEGAGGVLMLRGQF